MIERWNSAIFLRHHGDTGAQAVLLRIRHLLAVDIDAAALGVVQPLKSG